MSQKKTNQPEYGTELKLAAVRRVLAEESVSAVAGCPVSRGFRDAGAGSITVLSFHAALSRTFIRRTPQSLIRTSPISPQKQERKLLHRH